MIIDSIDRSAFQFNTQIPTINKDNSDIGVKVGISEEANSLKDKNSISLIKELSDKDKDEINDLKRIERDVISHERDHIANGGDLVRGAASYTFQIGPDGKKYISGGEVHIDMSLNSDDPEATIKAMRQVRQAALAPSSPSSQDMSVAYSASMKEAQARIELTQKSIAQFTDNPVESSTINYKI